MYSISATMWRWRKK